MNSPHDLSLQNIYIQNRLLVIFKEIAREQGQSIDYLINESMRTYARQHNVSVLLNEHVTTGDFGDISSSKEIVNAEIRPLFLWFNGQRHIIDIPRFIIGRGGQNKRCDLVIPDHNISRQHCVVTFLNGEHYIQDLNSTNGIEFNREKVAKKVIREGQSYYLCDYPVSFTYDISRTF